MKPTCWIVDLCHYKDANAIPETQNLLFFIFALLVEISITCS